MNAMTTKSKLIIQKTDLRAVLNFPIFHPLYPIDF